MSDETQEVGQAEYSAPAVDTVSDTEIASQPEQGSVEAVSSHEDTFFDPNNVPEELRGAYKQMQGAFTKKTQAIAEQRKKVEAYDSFMSDPIGQMQQMAKEYGYSISRGEAANLQAQQQQQEAIPEDWQPNSWNEVMDQMEQRAISKVMDQLSPVLSEVQKIKQGSIEQHLDSVNPEWRQYEDEMTSLLQQHPTMASNPDMLLKMVIPDDVVEARATQRALQKLQNKGNVAQAGGVGSQTPRTVSAETPNKPLSFEEAVSFAKQQLAKKGKGLR